MAWVDKYLLPHSGLWATSADLYAARCAVLHSYTFESRLSRSGQARQIFYTWGEADHTDLQLAVEQGGYNAVAVHIDWLFEAFIDAIHRFESTIDKDPQLAQLVYGRAERFPVNVPR
jgi:hypothetical protein